MSKEKNSKQGEPAVKKERTSVLEKIRRRTGLLVGIVGLALVIFILESLLGSGSSIFGGDELRTVGSINGKKIDRNEFINRMEQQLNTYRQRNQKNDVDENVRASVIDNVWQQYVVDLAIRPQFEKAGIVVGDDELYDRVVANPVQYIIQQLSDPQTGKVNEQFARPDGSLDLVKWKQAVQNLPADQEAVLRNMEENVKTTRYFEKYRTLITKGLYLNNAEVTARVKSKSARINMSYVIKPYDAISDSAVKISDSDIEKYYKENAYRFMNQETTRAIEYVAFNVVPSPEDVAALEKDAQRAAEEFKTKKSGADDSAFIAQESENGDIRIENFTRKTMIVRDSGIFNASIGTVYGPYNEGAYFKIYKLMASNSIADSCEIRHILVGLSDPQTQQAKRTKEQAKRQADSVLALIKSKAQSFDTLVKTFSDDMGSKTNGGNYGWFGEDKNFVEPFKNAGLMGTKGNISVVETQFGYHIIEVLNVSKTRHTSYKVAQIFKPIQASDETNQKIFAQASQFAGENNNAERFDKAVEAQKLTKRVADHIKDGDRQLPGLDQARELVRWVYTAEKGDVNIFTLPNKHVVAKLSGIRNKGILPLEEVKDEARKLLAQQVKADLLTEEFRKAKASAKSIDEIARVLHLEVKQDPELIVEGNNIKGLGSDEILMGTALGMKPGIVSNPVSSDNGVAVLIVNSRNEIAGSTTFEDEKRMLEQMLATRSDYDVFNALKDISDIKDHKSRID
ncbi:MAG TPA: SurA N-terminal domain-containing protein [Bacteroidia bacterium]|nr:SurA N-terminal domain-containing protein [Bacteroidia bacterium]